MYQRYLEQLKEIWFHEHEEYKSYKFQAHWILLKIPMNQVN